MAILNLGAGNRIIDGAVNHDIWQHRPEINVTYDLNILPWPWDDSSFDNVTAWAVFEHLDIGLIDALAECHRILRHGGVLDIKLPWCRCEDAYNDPTHRYVVGRDIFNLFDRSTERGEAYKFYRDSSGNPPSSWRIELSMVSPSGTCIVGRLEAIKDDTVAD